MGALQLLPDGETPGNIRLIDAEPLSDAEIENILINTPARTTYPGRRSRWPWGYGARRYYRCIELRLHRLEATAKRRGLEEAGKAIVEELIVATPCVIEAASAKPPAGFPEQVAGPVFQGLAASARDLEAVTTAG